jgi:MFS family permease
LTFSPETRRAAMRFIVAVGLVSLFADMTYEGAHSIMGPYLKGLGANMVEVGLIAGLGEMLAASLRFFSGRLVDRTQAYWPVAILGYALNLLVIPALAFVTTWKAVVVLVVIERTGKALRGPARDVLLSQATSEVGHGWGFGIHSAMDQTGAVVGPLLMVVVVARTHQFAPGFLLLGISAALALLSIVYARLVHPVKGHPPATKGPQPLPAVFWMYVIAAGFLAFGFIDWPMLAYHLDGLPGMAPQMIPLLFAGAMGVEGLAALLFGRLYDRYGIVVMVIGTLISMFSLPLGFLGGPMSVALGVACWATGLGAQDASLRSGISQVVSMNKRGNAFGAFNGVFGVTWFLGSIAMGLLYAHSLMALVAVGMGAQLIAAVMFFWLRRPLAAAAAAA